VRAAPRTLPESETASLPARSRTRDAGGAFHGDPDGAEKFMAQLLAGPRARENVQAGDPDDAIRSYQANLAWRRGDKTALSRRPLRCGAKDPAGPARPRSTF